MGYISVWNDPAPYPIYFHKGYTAAKNQGQNSPIFHYRGCTEVLNLDLLSPTSLSTDYIFALQKCFEKALKKQ